ncbi:MAG: hypothetical protein MJ252_23775, partial [archaeon]|nr:hypothetical protein [archaeon]
MNNEFSPGPVYMIPGFTEELLNKNKRINSPKYVPPVKEKPIGQIGFDNNFTESNKENNHEDKGE